MIPIDKAERIVYISYVVGQGNMLLSPRTSRSIPTREQAAEQLAMFNHTKMEEFRSYEIAVYRQSTVHQRSMSFDGIEIKRAQERVEKKKAAIVEPEEAVDQP